MTLKTIKIHPAAEAYRLMTEEELASLAADMAANGQRDPIVLGRVNGAASEALVDGRNRLRACEIVGIEPQFETRQFENDDEVRAFVKSRGERRNISKGEQAMAVAWLYPEPEYRAWIVTQPTLMADLVQLRGKDLICHCAPLRCHAEVLLELANPQSDGVAL